MLGSHMLHKVGFPQEFLSTTATLELISKWTERSHNDVNVLSNCEEVTFSRAEAPFIVTYQQISLIW